MQAFERVVADLLRGQGYWCANGFKVNLSKEEKVEIGRPSSPRWEIDVIAYSPVKREILAVECKSFLDSNGVDAKEVFGARKSTRYKLFNEPELWRVVSARLKIQLLEAGQCHPDDKTKLALACGKLHNQTNETEFRDGFASRDWVLFAPGDIRRMLDCEARKSYENSEAAIVSKLYVR